MTLVALLAVLAVDAGHAELVPIRDPFGEVPRAYNEVEVPGQTQVLGRIPVKLRAMVSSEKPEVLTRHFYDRFVRLGLYVPPPPTRRVDTFQPQVTAFDAANFMSYSVLLIPNGDTSTTVVLGEANVTPRADGNVAPPVPVPPKAEHVVTSTMESAALVSFTTSLAPVEVTRFYKTTLGQAGYRDVAGHFVKDRDDILVQPISKGGRTQVGIIKRVMVEP